MLPSHKIKHIQGRLAGVFCFTPGRRQDFEIFMLENRSWICLVQRNTTFIKIQCFARHIALFRHLSQVRRTVMLIIINFFMFAL